MHNHTTRIKGFSQLELPICSELSTIGSSPVQPTSIYLKALSSFMKFLSWCPLLDCCAVLSRRIAAKAEVLRRRAKVSCRGVA